MLRKLFCKHNYLWTAEIKIFRFDKMIKERGYNYDDV